ncbi:MAG: ROK family transcriptional regulator [Pseudomonadota bacterium]
MRGGDSTGLRAYNARLIVDAVRQAGALSKAEIARATGLSGQGASVIVNALIAEGVLEKRPKVRGQIGQPSTPIALKKRGATAIGVKIGRRSLEVLCLDLTGEVLESRVERYAAPLPGPTLSAARTLTEEVLERLGPAGRTRLAGIGIAMPDDLHAWSEELDLPATALADWREADPAALLAELTEAPVTRYNDATAACAAEILAGVSITRQSALYFYIGTFVGGGVVIGGRLYRGARQTAGALGSFPIDGMAPDGRPAQLIHAASAIDLERALSAAGLDAAAMITGQADDAARASAEPVFAAWCARAAPALARAIVGAISVVDFETVVIDGVLNPRWRRALRHAVAEEIRRQNLAGLTLPELATGSVGAQARVLGAALLPLNDRFSPDIDLLVRGAIAR